MTTQPPQRYLPVFLTVAAFALALLVASCTKAPKPQPEHLSLTAVTFDDLPGWSADRQGAALAAFRRSCTKPNTAAASKDRPFTITTADWVAPCMAAKTVDAADEAAVRSFFERWFRPFKASNGEKATGLFTGYFEAELHGSRVPGGPYTIPLYRVPEDHVTVDLSKFDPSLKGRHIVGRVDGGRLKPYYSRGDIENGALKGRHDELLWVDDPIDAFILHIQGSGRVVLPDGQVIRVGYAGNNGLPYRSIGRALIDRGALPPGGASWNDIRHWIDTHKDQVKNLLAVNRRYIFFREIDGDGPIGAEGVALTPRRSLAVDPRFIPYGLPIWLDTVWPNQPDRPLRRLMIAQDTGSAIRGPVRADFFWGHGKDALAEAGRMKSKGVYYLLLPATAAARLAGS